MPVIDSQVLGAYGLRLDSPAGADIILGKVPATWLPWRVDAAVASDDPEQPAPAMTVTDGPRDGSAEFPILIGRDRARSPVAGGGTVSVQRLESATSFVLPFALPFELLMHPLLAFTAVVTARWRGMQSFHAGAFVVAGGAWGILGEKGTGKSSLLAALAGQGCGIVVEDILVIDGGTCLIGPRAIDLRTRTAPLFPQAQSMGRVGTRTRWRLALDPAPAEVPLRGWLTLGWGATKLSPVAPAERLPHLIENLAIQLPPSDPGALLDLAALPMHTYTRPRDLDGLASSAASLLTLLPE